MLGLGRFGGGLGVSRWLLAQGARVLVTDLASRESLGEAVDELANCGAELILGSHDQVDIRGADLLVLNPAVPLQSPLVRRALEAGVALTSEVALLMERWPGPVVGVTGSNGKSTTVSLTRAVLEAAGRPAVAGGNLGGSLLDQLENVVPGTVAVLELSSFMLETLAFLDQGPDVAVITNITPNHIDRHGDFSSYRDAKAAIMSRAKTVVLNGDDQQSAGLVVPPGVATVWFGETDQAGTTGAPGRSRPDVGVDEAGNLREGAGGLILASEDIPLPGLANRLDLAAAILAAAAVVGEVAAVVAALPEALPGFRLPPHRLETVATCAGVLWVDDSVSTTPESTAASLAALSQQAPPGRRCLLIAGGRDKGLDAAPMVRAAARYTARVLTIGEEGQRLGDQLAAAGVSWQLAGTLQQAVSQAAGWARRGDCILLSPGYSSHDQFVHFAARGHAFRAAVAGLVASEPLS